MLTAGGDEGELGGGRDGPAKGCGSVSAVGVAGESAGAEVLDSAAMDLAAEARVLGELAEEGGLKQRDRGAGVVDDDELGGLAVGDGQLDHICGLP